MRVLFVLLSLTIICSCARGKEVTYVGSTPVAEPARKFLEISLIDSIDFIRWKIVFVDTEFRLSCQYGISKPNTSGFIAEKRIDFSGNVSKEGNYYRLKYGNEVLWLFEINSNLIHLSDKDKNLLSGNGGFSYTLSNTTPIKSDVANLPAGKRQLQNPMVYEGRTRCQELSEMLGLVSEVSCFKLKWYFVFYTDSITGKPSKFYMNGTAYRKETMNTGKWQLIEGKDGREILKLTRDDMTLSMYLLRVGNNILVFTDASGNLFVGNEDFSYTLNRRDKEIPSLR